MLLGQVTQAVARTLAVAAFSCCIGPAFVRDFRGLTSEIASRARDTDVQRVVNKIVGWGSVVGATAFLYGAVVIVIAG